MKIVVFDIDDTMTYEEAYLKKHAPKFLKKKYGMDVELVNPYGHSVADIYNVESLLILQGLTKEEASKKAAYISQDFWNSHFVKYCFSPLRSGLKEKIDQFRKSGYQIHLVSMRGKKSGHKESTLDKFIRLQIIPLLTKIQLTKGKVKYDKMKLASTIEDKINYISSINPDFIFEDQADIINALSEKVGRNSEIVCVKTCGNVKKEISKRAVRIDGYYDDALVEKMERVQQQNIDVKKQNKSTINFTSINKSFIQNLISRTAYRVIKIVGSPIALATFKPIVCGQENIPKEKSVAFVGNHRTKNDPIIISAITPHIIRWAALKRMFVGKEDLFSSTKKSWRCYSSAGFIKIMGAFPIARVTDEDYQKTNLKSMKYCSQTLAENKESVGFYPEGTLNRHPDKQNILPLKSDHIFRLASKNGNYIQPFSVVWIPNNIGIKNKVIVKFPYPINSENRTRNELYEMWHEVENKCIDDSNELISKVMEINEQGMNKKEKEQKVKTLIKEFKSK